ncbi:pyrophosphate-energized vacuolar membrane proton pump [Pyrus ussuriensis x Pyrus communis]|uniref:Pyrophosphate-energized vacuolar membrane proton pump n=1 Tax=Pyrus ussuriensis x Pyrus communis TaxID=2448454 RepID=A0A5N5H7S5_9ROSA|nr:pyrophosphate-energized vacuolar membrane proton pump [Pyrus ussuriensis x Pyrus communis]
MLLTPTNQTSSSSQAAHREVLPARQWRLGPFVEFRGRLGPLRESLTCETYIHWTKEKAVLITAHSGIKISAPRPGSIVAPIALRSPPRDLRVSPHTVDHRSFELMGPSKRMRVE